MSVAFQEVRNDCASNAHASDLHQRFQSYYDEVASTLLHGTHERKPLPYELVRLICRLARFTAPSETLAFETSIHVRAMSAKRVIRLWCETRPLSQSDIMNAASIVAKTSTRHQGWVSMPDHGTWSWTALAILTPEREGFVRDEKCIRRSEEGHELMWTATQNPVGSRGWVDGTSSFDAEHDVWKYIQPGDSVGLFACAQFGAWSCEGVHAALEITKFYEPSCVD